MNLNLKLLALAAALILVCKSFGCTNIIVSKGASQTGSVMVSYSADSHVLYGELYYKPAATYPQGATMKVYEWDTGKFLGEIAQAEKTYSTIGNMNEHQLIIAESTWGGRSELADSTGIMDYGSLIYITLQRARTAREAIVVLTGLAEKYGYYSSGESISIADPNEAWILEITGKGVKMIDGANANKGAVWVAARVPDGYVSAHANHARIGNFPLDDPDNWLYSKGVISFARENGFFEGDDSEFSFTKAYAPLDYTAMRGCEARVWSVFRKIDESMDKHVDYAMGRNAANPMPLFVKPNKKLTLKDMVAFMRDHYEGTPLDMRNDIGAGGQALPYRWRPLTWNFDGVEYMNERAIATQQTGFWFVGEARSWLPDVVGGILWFGVDDAGTSCLTPVYSASNRVPECFEESNGSMLKYSSTSAFWLFNRVSNFAYLRYDMISKDILAAADAFIDEALTEIPSVDAEARALYEKSPERARSFITNYSIQTARQLFDTWNDLDKYLLVKYMDGNVKKERNGKFLDNGHDEQRSEMPDFPGYNDTWKRAVVRDAGDRLKVIK